MQIHWSAIHIHIQCLKISSKWSNTRIIEVPERDNKVNEFFEDTMVTTFITLMKDIEPDKQ